MICRWDYQRDQQQYYKHDWDRGNRFRLRAYRAEYRENHPEETKQQRLKDWRTFQQRNPERWKEINRIASAKSRAKRKALKQAMREALQKGKR